MRTLLPCLLIAVGLSLSACEPADEGDVYVAEEVDSDVDLGATQEALQSVSFPRGSGLSIERCLTRQICTWECTEPVGPDDIYHCKNVCRTYCM